MKVKISLAVALVALSNTLLSGGVLPEVDSTSVKADKETHEKLFKEFKAAMKLSEKEARKVDNEMKKILLSKKDDDTVKLLVALRNFDEYKILYNELQMSTGIYSKNEDGDAQYHINGKELFEKELKAHIEQKDHATDAYLKKQSSARKEVAKSIHAYLKENKMASSLDNSKGESSYFVTEMSKKELKKFLIKYADSIKSIGLDAEHSYSIDSAMIATRVDPVVLDWTPQRNNQRGGGIGIYFSDAQCNDPEDVEGLYHEFDGTTGDASNNNHTFLVGGIIASVAPDAFKYCKNANYVYENALPTTNEISNSIGPRIRVETYSLNRNSANSNVYTTEDAIFDEHVRDVNIPVFISTGNHNDGDPTVVESPAKAYNIISVGNYDDGTDNIHVTDGGSGLSNYENPTLGNEKPELVAPGTNISYAFNGRQVTNRTGTSFAAPHAAAIAADILAENPFLQGNVPVLKAMMLASATDVIGDVDDAETTEDSAVGAGGINVQRPIYNDRFAAYWYDPNGNGPFSWSGTSSCYTGWTFTAPSYYAHARVAFTWEINEDYVLNNNAHGTVLFFYVTDANGNIVTTSFDGSTEYPNANNWQEDNWAVAEFNPNNTNSTYTLNICRYNTFSPDHNAELNMGVAVTAY
ncbi:MAG: S8 family serine peptidase [Campylobacterales bacterium]|nr:S8 family serine peptidase [Campylobacterales bacterium]